MNEETMRELYVASVKDYIDRVGDLQELLGEAERKNSWEACVEMVLSVAREMKEQGFDHTTLEELAQRIV
jgi:hypothetical protein